MTIHVVGCGPGHRDGLTLEALRVVRLAQVLIGASRLLELFARHKGVRIEATRPEQAIQAIREHDDKNCAVLVTGDPGLASLAQKVRETFPDRVRVVPGVSSAIAACALAGYDWQGVRFLSLHAESGSGLPEGSAVDSALVILGGPIDAGARLGRWCKDHGGDWTCQVVREIGFPTESVESRSLEELEGIDAKGRVVFLLRRNLSEGSAA